MVEEMAMSRLAKLDPSWSGRAIYHNAQSRFCLPDDQLRRRALDYVQDGQALTLFLGHSNAHGFAAEKARYLDREDWANLSIEHGPGVFATFGCNGCQLLDGDEGYGVAAFRNPRGPVAVLGSHGICFAAMVLLASDRFTQSFCAERPPERLGDAWLKLREGLARDQIPSVTYWLLDQADGDLSIPQATQRLEHQEMFVLLGDPALRLPTLPVDIKLTVDGKVAPGETIAVTGEAPARLASSKITLTLERHFTSEPADLRLLPDQPPEERAKVMLANHEAANRFILSRRELMTTDGRFEARFDLPRQVPWPQLLLRAYAVQEGRDGTGTLLLTLPKNDR
jgi:hypothetical protein